MEGFYASLYGTWVDSYDPEEKELSVIQKHVSLIGKRVLDIGCGTGRFLLRILPFVKEVIGIDSDHNSISVLKEKLHELPENEKAKVKLVCQPIEECDRNTIDQVDVVVFSWSLNEMNRQQLWKVSVLLLEVLKEDGHIVILQPTGGSFDKIIQQVFEDYQGKAEHKIAQSNIEQVLACYFDNTVRVEIESEFCTTKDAAFISKVMQMYAVTHGEKTPKEAESITEEFVSQEIQKYPSENGVIHFKNTVDMYVLSKQKTEYDSRTTDRYLEVITKQTLANNNFVRENFSMLATLSKPEVIEEAKKHPEYRYVYDIVHAVSNLEVQFKSIFEQELSLINQARALCKLCIEYYNNPRPTKDDYEQLCDQGQKYYEAMALYDYADWLYIKGQAKGQAQNKSFTDFDKHYKEQEEIFTDYKNHPAPTRWDELNTSKAEFSSNN